MSKKYLLYIDILGFSDLVARSPKKIPQLYKIIDELNVHKHDVFKTLVFSDTILVYNKAPAHTEHDHSYIVMYSIEFAQDLFYRLVGKNIFFRATLCFGEFNHSKLKNVDGFYGPALTDSYNDQKTIPGTGIFLHKSVWKRNDIFHVVNFSRDYRFAIINQVLDSAWQDYRPHIPFPISPYDFEDLDLPWEIAEDVVFFRNVYKNMNNHPEPNVRTKFLTTWQLYRKRFGPILDALEKSKFDPKVLVPDFDWNKAMKQAEKK